MQTNPGAMPLQIRVKGPGCMLKVLAVLLKMLPGFEKIDDNFLEGEKIRIVKHYYMDAKGNEVWNFFVVVDVVLAGSSI